MTELLNTPPKSSYKNHSEKLFFSYSGDHRQFQTGYYGASPDATIAGNLHLRFPSSEPILATKIELILKGKEKVKWTEHHGESHVTYRASDIFINQLYQLWTTSTDGTYEEIRNLDIPFEIKLPANLPPSIKIDKGEGKIRYKLIVNIKRKSNLWKLQGSEKSIALNLDFNTYAPPPPINLPPINWYQLNDYEAITRGFGYNITLENSIGGPNTPFSVNFVLKFYKQDFKLTKIFFGVKEHHKLTTKRKTRTHKRYIAEENVKGEEIRLNSNGEVITKFKLQMPTDNKKFCWTIKDRKHILVSHKFKIKMHCGGIFTKNIKLESPVEIKNIVAGNNDYNDSYYSYY